MQRSRAPKAHKTTAHHAIKRAAHKKSPLQANKLTKRAFSTAATEIKDDDVCIVSACRTPMGSFQGGLSPLSAVELGSISIKESLKRAGLSGDKVNEVIFGNVVSSGLGQAPARQAAIGAGLPPSTICTTVNKVCSSGLKTIMYAANEIRLGQAEVVVAGGMESMSNIPYLLPTLRNGARFGDSPALDGLMKDGLTDAYGKYPMGNCAEVCANEMKLTREMQDEYAKTSYSRAQAAIKGGKFVNEIVPVEIKSRKGAVTVAEDEEPFKVNFDKLATLKPAFSNPLDKDAKLTVTAGNASVLSDGAAAVVLVSGKYAKANGLKVRAKVLSYADYEQEPLWFTTAPAKAVPKALALAGLTVDDVQKAEINEAFSAVALANQSLLGLPADKLNIYGGAVALGHPLGASGTRVLVTLLSALEQDTPADKRKIGVASLCNGGGGASAVVVESLM